MMTNQVAITNQVTNLVGRRFALAISSQYLDSDSCKQVLTITLLTTLIIVYHIQWI